MQAMLVGLCGTQGSGKTSILSELGMSAKYKKTRVVLNTSSRSIVAKYNIAFDASFYSDPHTIAQFQVEVLKQMCDSHYDMLSKVLDDECVVTDRTYLDLDSYVHTNLGMYPEFEGFIQRYHKLCALLASICFDSIVMMPYPQFADSSVAVDSTRPTSKVHQRLIHTNMMDLVKSYGGLVRFGLFTSDSTIALRQNTLYAYITDELPKIIKSQKTTAQSNRLLLLKLIINSIDSILSGTLEI